jgi:hypothetical protein
LNGTYNETLLELLKNPDLLLFIKMKAKFVLGSIDREQPGEDLVLNRHYLDEAEKMLAECKEVYESAEDVQHLQRFGTWIEEERQVLQRRMHDGECNGV